VSTEIYEQLVCILARYGQAAGPSERDACAATTAASLAFAEPHFRDALEQLLGADPGCPTVGRFYRALASLPADDDQVREQILTRLADGSPESVAFDCLMAAAADTGCGTAGPDAEEVIAAVLAAILIERSSLGDNTARHLRNRTEPRDAARAIQAWRQHAEIRPAPAADHDAHSRGSSPARNEKNQGQSLAGENCTVFFTDVVGFGSRARTESDRLLIREALYRMTQAALQGIPEARSEDRGDGFLTVVPPTVSIARVIDQLFKELPAALELHNRTHRASARFKMRLAVNVGPVFSDTMGVSGEGIIVTHRLAEAPTFKRAIVENTASLGIIASRFVYETVIMHGRDQTDTVTYSEVQVDVKESSFLAWMKLFDAPQGLQPAHDDQLAGLCKTRNQPQPGEVPDRASPSRSAAAIGTLLTPAEVATMFRVDPKMITRWAKAGKLTSIRTLGGHRRYRETEVRALLEDIPHERSE
jgi:excisionase family DNA binding protein